MDQKRILLLVSTLGVLLLAAWLSGYFGGAPSTNDMPELLLASDEINSITIRKGADQIVATRSTGGDWRLEQPVDGNVDTTTSKAFLDGWEGARVESLVSSRADRHSKFQVDSTQATHILLEGEDKLELWVGKTGPDFQSRYVRFGSDVQVFLATGVPVAEPSLDRWKNKELWSYPKESISAVSVQTPEGTFRIVSGDTGWALEQEDGVTREADSAKVDRYIGRLASVKADGFLPEVDRDTAAESATHVVDIQRIDGSSSQLRIWTRENDAAAVRDGTNDVVKFSSYRTGTLAPEPAELLSELSND